MKRCFANNKMYHGAGSDLTSGKRGSPKECQEWCKEMTACDLFTYVLDRRVCYLKKKGLNPTLVYALNRVSGPKSCPGTCLSILHLQRFHLTIDNVSFTCRISRWKMAIFSLNTLITQVHLYENLSADHDDRAHNSCSIKYHFVRSKCVFLKL